MSKLIGGCYASCRGKNLSCGTTHSTDCTYKSRGFLVGVEVAVNSKRRKLAGESAKGTPPPKEGHLTRRCQNGVSKLREMPRCASRHQTVDPSQMSITAQEAFLKCTSPQEVSTPALHGAMRFCR